MRKGGRYMEIAENARPLNKDVAIQIGQRIQSCRLEKTIKAIDLATAIGIGKDQLSRIENGRVVCTTENLFLIAQYLNVSFDFLLFGKDLSSDLYDCIKVLEGLSQEQIVRAKKVLEACFL